MTPVTLHIPPDHPAFAGHFPGNPVVPGVVLLDLAQCAVEQALGRTVSGLAVAKFHRPVRPGETVSLQIGVVADAARFVLDVNGQKVADGRFLLAEPGA